MHYPTRASVGYYGAVLQEDLMMDPTIWEYPDIALPPQKYLDKAARQWEKYGID